MIRVARTYLAKRAIDVVVATLGLLASLPGLLILAFSLAIVSGESPIFAQERVGRHERVFRLYKLRTLLFTTSGRRQHWLTWGGRMLRTYSIDELPQLWNVIRGDMSLVGPRPLLVEYLPHYSAEQRIRHSVRPGITGWAQVHGRNALPWPERFALDRWYVEHVSLGLDISILWLTLQRVLSPQHVRPEGLSEAEKFRGIN